VIAQAVTLLDHKRSTANSQLWAEIRRFFREKLPDITEALSRRINNNFQVLKNASSS
jgi:hypothetical protein